MGRLTARLDERVRLSAWFRGRCATILNRPKALATRREEYLDGSRRCLGCLPFV